MSETGNLTHDLSNSRKDAAQERLKSFVERVARLMQERKTAAKEFADDIREVVAEAKGEGFDAKILRKTAAEKVRRDNMDKDDLDEEEALLAIYFRAAGIPVRGGEDE
ncbi:MAG: DUF2312 domain-containing protein [Patescibacteria group bacterium]|nr:DUF2312 domain-containing protein [Patescibacteria group bacterium]